MPWVWDQVTIPLAFREHRGYPREQHPLNAGALAAQAGDQRSPPPPTGVETLQLGHDNGEARPFRDVLQ